MDYNNLNSESENIILLIKKVQENSSTPEEDLILLDSMKVYIDIFRTFVKEIKVEQLKESIRGDN